jgi:hypothetical protein
MEGFMKRIAVNLTLISLLVLLFIPASSIDARTSSVTKSTIFETSNRIDGNQRFSDRISASNFILTSTNDPSSEWNTFLGSAAYDYADDIAVDENGDIYVVGCGYATWGTPLNPYAGGADVYVVKLNENGVLQWSTFMGSDSDDFASSIAMDGTGNIYVTGTSEATWATPVHSFSGGRDIFIAKLNNSGALQWITFMGSTAADFGIGIVIEGNGNIYVDGFSENAWGTPIKPYVDGWDTFVARLDNSGILQWNTFLGSAGDDYSTSIEIDESRNIYVTGYGGAKWGMPVNPWVGLTDGFVAKLHGDPQLTISGNAGVGEAILGYTDGIAKTVTSDGEGDYSFTVPYHWSGTITPSKIGYTFDPVSITYTNIASDQAGQDYTATLNTYSISGNAGVAGATITYTGGSTNADGSGHYTFTVPYGWMGTVTPSKNGYIFDPYHRDYSDVTANQANQDYNASGAYKVYLTLVIR